MFYCKVGFVRMVVVQFVQCVFVVCGLIGMVELGRLKIWLKLRLNRQVQIMKNMISLKFSISVFYRLMFSYQVNSGISIIISLFLKLRVCVVWCVKLWLWCGWCVFQCLNKLLKMKFYMKVMVDEVMVVVDVWLLLWFVKMFSLIVVKMMVSFLKRQVQISLCLNFCMMCF